LALASRSLAVNITYVVAHELSHMVEARHNERFWRFVDRLVPDSETRKQRLAENGSTCSLFILFEANGAFTGNSRPIT
jgi:Protein of unknown function DUF45